MKITTKELINEGKTTLKWVKMGNDERKMWLRLEQDGKCPSCELDLPDKPRGFDIARQPDHPYSKKDYRDKSICYVRHSICHQAVDHGNIPWFTQLAAVVQAREEVQRMRIRQGNRTLAIERNMDDPSLMPGSVAGLSDALSVIEDGLTKDLAELMKNAQPIAEHAVQVPGVGPTTIARVLAEIDIHRAEYRGSLHHFAGFVKGFDRMEKGEMGEDGRRKRGPKRPYNARLKTAMWNLTKSMVVYGISKVKKTEWPDMSPDERTEAWHSLTWGEKFAIGKRVAPELYVVDFLKQRAKMETEDHWKSEDHRNNAAIRWTAKLFLSHLWEEWRKLEGLPTPLPYSIAILGHSGYISPQERGWPE